MGRYHGRSLRGGRNRRTDRLLVWRMLQGCHDSLWLDPSASLLFFHARRSGPEGTPGRRHRPWQFQAHGARTPARRGRGDARSAKGLAAMIDLNEVGAHVVSAGQVRFGVYLPEITAVKGYSVIVRVIHEKDQFTPEIPPRDFALTFDP